MADIMTLQERSEYAEQVFLEACHNGKGRTFGAQCAAYVRDYPEQAKAMSDHHIESFLEKRGNDIHPQLNNRFLIHKYVKENVRRIRPDA